MADGQKTVIRAGQVAGAEVYSDKGEHIGHVVDLVIEQGEGRVTVAIVSFARFLGFGEELHPLPWSMLDYDAQRHRFVVPVTREELERAPRYHPDQEPEWDDVFHRNLNTHYGQPYLV